MKKLAVLALTAVATVGLATPAQAGEVWSLSVDCGDGLTRVYDSTNLTKVLRVEDRYERRGCITVVYNL